jgi:hypothetical protein
MRIVKLVPGAICLVVAAAACQAQEKGVLLTGSQRTSFTWEVSDASGSRWDIQYNGQVGNGTNSAYSSGMMLSVNGSQFSWGSEGIQGDDRREVQVGPWQNGTIRVWRRIAVPAKGGFCRWIDLFENSSSSPQTAKVRYQIYAGGGNMVVQSTLGKEQVGEGDWGFLTGDAPTAGSGRPVLAHVFADKGSKVMPKVQAPRNNNVISYDFDLTVPAGKTVALCLYESQQKSVTEAQEFLKKFRPGADLQGISPELRKIILNVHGGVFTVGSLEMNRDDKLDLAVLRDSGNELLGTILDTHYVVETSYGKLDLPAERVVGLVAPPEAEGLLQIALTDGQVVAGKLLSEPLRLKLESGSEMSLPAAKISTLAYRISPQRPEQIALAHPTLLVRSGQRLYFKPADVSYAFLTETGQIDLRPEDLSAIYMDTPEGGLHRAAFRNGSVLAGLLVQKDLKAVLELGPTFAAPASSVTQFVFPGEAASTADLAEATLRNEDVLRGRIAQDSFTVKTRFGDVKVDRADLAELKLSEGTMDRVELKLHNGTAVTGQFVDPKIRFKIEPGPEVPLFIGHVVRITCPKPPPPPPPAAGPATRPATAPSAGASTSPSAGSGDSILDRIRLRRQRELGASATQPSDLEAIRAQREDLRRQAETLARQAADFSRLGKAVEAEKLAAQQAEIAKKLSELDALAAKIEGVVKDRARSGG